MLPVDSAKAGFGHRHRCVDRILRHRGGRPGNPSPRQSEWCTCALSLRASRNFEGIVWASYDVCFRRQAANKRTLDWATVDASLPPMLQMLTCCPPPALVCFHPPPKLLICFHPPPKLLACLPPPPRLPMLACCPHLQCRPLHVQPGLYWHSLSFDNHTHTLQQAIIASVA